MTRYSLFCLIIRTTSIFGGVGPYASTDAGLTWKFLAGAVGATAPASHADQHAAAVDPFNGDFVYVGNDGGFYSIDLAKDVWTPLSFGFSAGQIQAIGPNPADNTKLIAGFQDNGTQIYSGSQGWPVGGGTELSGGGTETGDGGLCVIRSGRFLMSSSYLCERHQIGRIPQPVDLDQRRRQLGHFSYKRHWCGDADRQGRRRCLLPTAGCRPSRTLSRSDRRSGCVCFHRWDDELEPADEPGSDRGLWRFRMCAQRP